MFFSLLIFVHNILPTEGGGTPTCSAGETWDPLGDLYVMLSDQTRTRCPVSSDWKSLKARSTATISMQLMCQTFGHPENEVDLKHYCNGCICNSPKGITEEAVAIRFSSSLNNFRGCLSPTLNDTAGWESLLEFAQSSHQMRAIGLRGWCALVLHPTALLFFHLSLRGEENGRACKKGSLTLKKALLEICFKSEQKGFYLLFGVREEMIYMLKRKKFWWIWRNLNRQSAPLVLAGWKSIRLQYSETKIVFPICISHIHITISI